MHVSSHLFYHTLVEHILPNSTAGSIGSQPVLIAIQTVVRISGTQEATTVLSRLVNVEKNAVIAYKYLDKASSRLHDTIMSKFANSIFAGLPTGNPLSSYSLVSVSNRTKYCRREVVIDKTMSVMSTGNENTTGLQSMNLHG